MGSGGSSSDAVFRMLLDGIFDRSIPLGAPISEHRIAERCGVSRTPVRDAVQRLKSLGLVESSAGRTTRVVSIDESDLRDALVAWSALYGAVLAEVVPVLTDADVDAMEARAADYAAASARLDAVAAAEANFELFTVPVARSRNAALVDAIAATVYIVRLGGLSLPRWIDAERLGDAQRVFLAAVRRRDADAAAAAAHEATRFQYPAQG